MPSGFLNSALVLGVILAQPLPQISMTWNEAPYSCELAIGGQMNPYAPRWEQHIPIFVSLRRVGGVNRDTYSCRYDAAPATAPDVTPGQPVTEALVWDGQAFACIWTGNVAQSAADPAALGPVNLTIRRADDVTLDGYICS